MSSTKSTRKHLKFHKNVLFLSRHPDQNPRGEIFQHHQRVFSVEFFDELFLACSSSSLVYSYKISAQNSIGKIVKKFLKHTAFHICTKCVVREEPPLEVTAFVL
ncbi:unnamed protein product [Cuscuta epithymum]|uniref:Uncharacterized protein n=1 Tax=Cuscuta epithymum TaxID=186058 RepID=A0AAV0EM75_9ASTE|nr:unnamed protein product [Cuscuta epithymum]